MFKTSSYTHAIYAPAKPVRFVPDSVLHLKRNVHYWDGPGGATHPRGFATFPGEAFTARIEADITVTEDGLEGRLSWQKLKVKKKQQQADHTARIFYFRATYT